MVLLAPFPINAAPASGILVEYNQASVACFVEQELADVGLAGNPFGNLATKHVERLRFIRPV